jgi:ElaB/YqjD/DUF883 family membrane-anchored ribosome-binding protein
MINPNGDELGQNDPLTGSMKQGGQPISQEPGSTSRLQDTTERVSAVASDAWRQTKETAGVARQRTEFFVRENPVPTVIGALAIGLAIGLAIRYSSESRRHEETELKTPFGDVNLGMLSLPFLWPFFKTVRRRYDDSAEVVRDSVKDGMHRLKKVDVDDYVKPLRKKWRNWVN